MKDFLKLPYPSINAKSTGKSILVFGASSSVGAVTVQMAVGSGLNVVTTASARHEKLAKELGATAFFDYNDPDIVNKLIAALKSAGEFAGIYDAIAVPSTRKICAEVLQHFGGGQIASSLWLTEGEKLPDGVTSEMGEFHVLLPCMLPSLI